MHFCGKTTVTEALTPDKQDKFQPLRDAYGAALPGRFVEIFNAWASVEQSGGKATDWSRFQRLIHTIAGSAGMFGFHALGDKARELEDFLNALQGYPKDERRAKIECGLAALRGLAEKK